MIVVNICQVGHGVEAFFYEPYQGLVHSPHAFVEGLGKGTSSLFSDVVSGAMNSTVAFVGTASRSISYLSGDAEYVRKRAVKRQRNRTDRGGIMDGLLDGSESVVSGLASGMSGLITKPLEEAQKNGIPGFFRGIGLGLMGAAVKPVLGLTDGITLVASGIQNQVSENVTVSRVRPARALERSAVDSSELVIVALNLDAAHAQEFVLKRSKQHGYEDAYLRFIPMDGGLGEAVILSDTYVYWRRSKSLWGRTWANISHCFYMGDAVGIMLYAGTSGVAEVVSIPCGTSACALKVYTALETNAQRMGNPANVIPVDLITQAQILPEGSSGASHLNALGSLPGRAATLAGELDGYRFGTANCAKLKAITGPEADVLKRGHAHIGEGSSSWAELDRKVWRLLWEWECTHLGMQATRCCATIIINRSVSPVQIVRVRMIHGKNVAIMGSQATGYELESRSVMPEGFVVVFTWAFSPSPIEIGHLKATVYSGGFNVTIASTQRETYCESKGGLTVGFLEKTVSEWWCKYVLLIS